MKDLTDLTHKEMIRECFKIGLDVDEYCELIEEMYWDGHTPREIKEMIQVYEGDCSICVD